MSGDRRVTRRAVLVGAVGIVVAACTRRRPGSPPPGPEPDADALAEAMASEQSLIAAYDAAAPAAGGDAAYVASLLAAHKEHLAALEQATGATRSATPSSSLTSSPTPAPTEDQLRAAETASARGLTEHAIAVQDGSHAALLASIAAAHQVYGSRRVVRFSSSVQVP